MRAAGSRFVDSSSVTDTSSQQPSDLPPAWEPATVEAELYQRWVDAGYFTADPASDKPPFCIVHAAAERHRQPPHGPRARPHPHGRADPAPPHAGLRGAVAARHGPRRHRHPERGRARARRRGQVPPRPGPRGVRRAGLGVEGRVRRQDPRPDAAPRRRRRLDPRAVHHGRGPVQGRPDDLQAAVRGRPDLPRRADHQLVPALPHRAVGHRGRALRRRGRARLDPLRRRRPLDRRGHHPRRDDARRHRGRRPPGRRAVPAPGRHRGRAAADRPADPDRRRRARRPGVRHRRGQGHPGARPERLRDRPAPRAADARRSWTSAR